MICPRMKGNRVYIRSCSLVSVTENRPMAMVNSVLYLRQLASAVFCCSFLTQCVRSRRRCHHVARPECPLPPTTARSRTLHNSSQHALVSFTGVRCRTDSGSAGQRVKWVVKCEWVTWVTGQYRKTLDP